MTYDRPQRLNAMVSLRRVVQSWSMQPAPDAVVPRPTTAQVDQALELLRCDRGPRADSRRRRAIAHLLGYDWEARRSKPLLRQLGIATDEAIVALKDRAVAQVTPEAFQAFGADPEWRAAVVLGLLSDVDDTFARQLGLQTSTSCWRPESKSTFGLVPPKGPYVEMTAHVSVDRKFSEVKKNIDAQRWDECGTFWSPPDPPYNPDGARIVKETWQKSCSAPSGPFDTDTSAPQPGDVYDARFLHEVFYCPEAGCQTMIENLLGVYAFETTEQTVQGTRVPAHQASYRLADCSLDGFEGALGGKVGVESTTTVLDLGWIRAWEENGRVHVRSLKQAQFSSESLNWLSQFNPLLQELNDELGEVACCLP